MNSEECGRIRKLSSKNRKLRSRIRKLNVCILKNDGRIRKLISKNRKLRKRIRKLNGWIRKNVEGSENWLERFGNYEVESENWMGGSGNWVARFGIFEVGSGNWMGGFVRRIRKLSGNTRKLRISIQKLNGCILKNVEGSWIQVVRSENCLVGSGNCVVVFWNYVGELERWRIR